MQTSDLEAFDLELAKLCAGFDVPVTKHRKEAYWAGLRQMSIVQFARCVEHALSEQGPDEFPTTKGIWKIHRSFRSQPQHAVIEQPQDTRDHLEYYANRLLLRHLGTRLGLGSIGRFKPGYGMVECQPSEELQRCRQATTAIVNWFTEPVREGADDATPAAFIESFIRAIASVSEITPAAIREWGEQVKDPAAQISFPPWMARPLPRTLSTPPAQLELA